MIITASNKRQKEKLSVRKQQFITNKVLSVVGNYLPKISNTREIIVAGGAPRNWYEKKLARDIDIFVWGINNIDSLNDKLDKLLGFKFVHKKSKYEAEESKSSIKQVDLFSDPFKEKKSSDYSLISLRRVYQGEYEDESGSIPFQVIELKRKIAEEGGTPKLEDFLIDMFDFDICKCFYDGNKVSLTPIAKRDFAEKTLTFSLELMEKHNRLSTLPRRGEKLQKYYPDHKIVIGK